MSKKVKNYFDPADRCNHLVLVAKPANK